jgi:tRNA (adenine58-N1)-methyltransferase non-catalytic subunit
VEPTLFNVCEYWFHKDQNRVKDLRIDTLSHMMNLGNVKPGGRYLAVDDVSGLLVSAVLERLGGKYSRKNYCLARLTSQEGHGRLITICDVDGPPAYPVMAQMNFPREMTSTVLASLNWSTAEEEYVPGTGSAVVHLAMSPHQIFSVTFTGPYAIGHQI